MTAPFTPEQSAEIDRRIVEMMTAVMGVGQYSRICQGIADRRAEQLAQAAPQHPGCDRRMECLKLAIAYGGDDPVSRAGEFAIFVLGDADA